MKTRMKEYRSRLGLTQEKLAEIVGVRRETIIFLEKASIIPLSGWPIKLPGHLKPV
jgi:DNA-binding XRE family transcriptional regulator